MWSLVQRLVCLLSQDFTQILIPPFFIIVKHTRKPADNVYRPPFLSFLPILLITPVSEISCLWSHHRGLVSTLVETLLMSVASHVFKNQKDLMVVWCVTSLTG